jgi:hypothetical protein
MDVPKETYEKGNAELLHMFKSKCFDRNTASRLLAEIPDLNQPILDLNGYSSTYLYEAQTFNNVEAVRLLLENGADPNLDIPELISDCALTDLHFLWEEISKEASQRLEIAKLFFEFGGDPNLWYDGETLYDHVLWEVFNDSITPHSWEYIERFFIILIAYGGGGGNSRYPKPSLSEPIDKTRINEYDLLLVTCEDGYHLEGHIFNPDGIDIGTV